MIVHLSAGMREFDGIAEFCGDVEVSGRGFEFTTACSIEGMIAARLILSNGAVRIDVEIEDIKNKIEMVKIEEVKPDKCRILLKFR